MFGLRYPQTPFPLQFHNIFPFLSPKIPVFKFQSLQFIIFSEFFCVFVTFHVVSYLSLFIFLFCYFPSFFSRLFFLFLLSFNLCFFVVLFLLVFLFCSSVFVSRFYCVFLCWFPRLFVPFTHLAEKKRDGTFCLVPPKRSALRVLLYLRSQFVGENGRVQDLVEIRIWVLSRV